LIATVKDVTVTVPARPTP